MDAGRLEQLLGVVAGRAWRLAWGLLRNADDAQDAVQQAFLVAARKPDRVPRDDPWPWFSVVVVQEAKNLRRKRRPRTNDPAAGGGEAPVERQDPGAVAPPEAAARAEEAARLWREIDLLPPPEREVVVLTHVAGLTHATAAEALGLPRQTVTDRARRGLATLEVRLRQDPAALARALAVVPVGEPAGGLLRAAAAWVETALVGTGVAAGATTATSVAGGVFMASKTVCSVALAVAAGIGFLGGGAVVGGGWFGGEGRGGLRPPATSALGEPTEPLPTPEVAGLRGSGEREVDAGRLRAENARLATRLAEVEREAQALRRAQGEEAAAGPRPLGPTFTFGEAGKLAAVREADWGDLVDASRQVGAALREAWRLAQAGEPVPRRLGLTLQENAERVRRYEYRVMEQLPTAARHNGELTHPISVTNLMAGELALGGQALTSEQVAAIEALGLAFEQDFARMRQGWRAGDLRARRVLDEYRLKGRFTEDLLAVLTEAQRALVADPSVRAVAGVDLHDPTLMILHTSPVFTGADLGEVRARLLAALRARLGVAGGETPPALAANVDRFLDRTRSVHDPVPAVAAQHYTYAQGLMAGEATVELLDACLRDLPVPTAQRTALEDDPTWYVPRRVRA